MQIYTHSPTQYLSVCIRQVDEKICTTRTLYILRVYNLVTNVPMCVCGCNGFTFYLFFLHYSGSGAFLILQLDFCFQFIFMSTF